MRQKNELPFLKALTDKSGQKNHLIFYFPREWAEELASSETSPLDVSPIIDPFKWAKDLHYSWFYEVLKDSPKSFQEQILTLLTPLQAKGLEKLLNVSAQKQVPKFAAFFYLHFLKQKLVPKDILPKELIPYSDLNVLLDLGKKELIHLIDLLGVYDLAQDMRQIVDKELLSRIYSALSRDMFQFLQFASKQPIKWISPKLNLKNWDGSKKELHLLLHQRGLFRLARALSLENPAFKWHLFHRLDTGRVKMMESAMKQTYDPSLTAYFKRQVLDLVQRYKQ